MFALIVGERGTGKSTLVQKIVAELARPAWGFVTKKEAATKAQSSGCPVHLYPAAGSRQPTEENRVAYCDNRRLEVRKEVFDQFALRLHAPVPDGALVVMDELGTLETVSSDFCAAVLDVLARPVLGIAAVKHKNSPFLQQVRAHENCRCFYLTKGNRDERYFEVLRFMKKAERLTT